MKAAALETSLTGRLSQIRWLDIKELSKARLTFLVLVTTLVGFYLAEVGPIHKMRLLHTMLGTALVAAAAAALNQVLEKDIDAKMKRTENRPLPAGRVQADDALLLAMITGVGGLAYLAFAVNLLSAALAALTLATYVFAYTPLKPLTSFNTLVGAIPGALPPVIGWTGATGELAPGAWTLFAILFIWQTPHFLAIAWLYREDYARAGLKMLPVVEPDGESTARQCVVYTASLIPISLTPAFFALVRPHYAYGAMVCGLVFLVYAFRFMLDRGDRRARQLFYASILYLPVLLGLMAFFKLR
jgi:protoheme IX farnesyltransferase